MEENEAGEFDNWTSGESESSGMAIWFAYIRLCIKFNLQVSIKWVFLSLSVYFKLFFI